MQELGIKRFRKSVDYTQESFGKIIGLSKSSYCKKEKGEVAFSLDEAYLIANHFKRPIEEIFGGYEIPANFARQEIDDEAPDLQFIIESLEEIEEAVHSLKKMVKQYQKQKGGVSP